MNPFSILLACSAFEAMVLALFLVLRPSPRYSANRALAGMLGMYTASTILHLFGHGDPVLAVLHPEFITTINTLCAPLVFLYARRLGGRTELTSAWRLAIGLNITVSLAVAVLAVMVHDRPDAFDRALFASGLVSVLANVAFLVAAIAGLRGLPRQSTAPDPIEPAMKRRWLGILIGLLLLYWVAILVIEMLSPLPSWDYGLAGYGLIIFMIGNLGVLQPALFWYRLEHQAAIASKYEKSGLPDHLAERYRQKLVEAMEQGGLFRNPDTDLAALGEVTRIPVHHLSQVINAHVGTSYYEYLQGLRVAEAARLLADPTCRDRSITELSLAAGFGSLSTFNARFKKATGLTPRQFRETKLPPRE